MEIERSEEGEDEEEKAEDIKAPRTLSPVPRAPSTEDLWAPNAAVLNLTACSHPPGQRTAYTMGGRHTGQSHSGISGSTTAAAGHNKAMGKDKQTSPSGVVQATLGDVVQTSPGRDVQTSPGDGELASLGDTQLAAGSLPPGSGGGSSG
ncbi:UNVERIFIED_CONTAM: hypothetical protein FKN15_071030 [Acipenser sinensis]